MAGSQSAGTVPLSLATWGCDMACGGSVKWACGGPGAAYLYVKPELSRHLNPMSTGWFAHAEPFAFDMGPMRYTNDAWRMIGGTMAAGAMASMPADIAYTQRRIESSEAGDLVFTLGEARWTQDGQQREGQYARIWQHRTEGWRIVYHQLLVPPPPR